MKKNIFRPSSKALQPFWVTMTYLPRVAPGAEPTSGFTLYRVIKDDTTKSNVFDALASRRVTWTVFQEDLAAAGATADPKVGDVLEDEDGGRWTVTRVPNELKDNVWDLETLKEV